MKYLFTTLFCGLFITVSFSQSDPNTFLKTYNVCGGLFGRDIFETETGYVVFAESSTSSSCLGVLKIDKKGDFVDEYIHENGLGLNADDPNKSWKDDDEIVFVAGNFQRDTIIQNISFTRAPIDDLNAAQTKYFLDSEWEVPACLQPKSDGGFLLLVEQSKVEHLQNGGFFLSETELMFWDLNNEGELINKQNFRDTFNTSKGGQFQILSNGEILIGYQGGESIISNDWHLSLLDSNYNEKWTRSIELLDHNTLNIMNLGDSLFLLAGGPQLISDPLRFPNGKVFAYDYNGNLKWEQTLVADHTEFFISRLFPTNSGDILGCGFHVNSTDMGTGTGRIFKLNSKGEILWDRDYWDGNFYTESFFSDIKVTQDGGIIVTGTFTNDIRFDPPNDYFDDILIMKLDSMGCLEPDCGDLIYTSTKEVLSKEALQIFPNPAFEQITIKAPIASKLKTISFYDLSGKLLKNMRNIDASDIQFPIAQFSNGIYLLQVILTSGEKMTEKISLLK